MSTSSSINLKKTACVQTSNQQQYHIKTQLLIMKMMYLTFYKEIKQIFWSK